MMAKKQGTNCKFYVFENNLGIFSPENFTGCLTLVRNKGPMK